MTLFRLLAATGLAALLSPPVVTASAAPVQDGERADMVDARAATEFCQANPHIVDQAFAEALAGRPAEPNLLQSLLSGVAAKAADCLAPEQAARQVAARAATLMQAPCSSADSVRAVFASEIVIGIERTSAARGLRLDRTAVASAALGGIDSVWVKPAAEETSGWLPSRIVEAISHYIHTAGACDAERDISHIQPSNVSSAY